MSQVSSVIIRRSISEWEEFCRQVEQSTEVPLYEEKSKQTSRKRKTLSDYNFFTKTYFPVYADSDCAYFHIDAANAIKNDPNILAAIEWPREHAKTVHMVIIMPMWLYANGVLDGMLLIGRTKDLASDALGDIKAHLENNALFKHDFAPGQRFPNFW